MSNQCRATAGHPDERCLLDEGHLAEHRSASNKTWPVEKVDHPGHYGGGALDPYEHIKVVEAWGLNYELGNATKYICRAGKKPGVDALEDLRKAQFYLNYEINKRVTNVSVREVFTVTAMPLKHDAMGCTPYPGTNVCRVCEREMTPLEVMRAEKSRG